MLDHPEKTPKLLAALKAAVPFEVELTERLVNQAEDGINFLLAVVKGIEPRDQVEALLAAQMSVTHNAIMTFAGRLACVSQIYQQDSAERAFNKLCRTFAAQVEALKRHRSSGEQTVRVEHVTVNAGGQAIVGHVSNSRVAGVGGGSENEKQPYGAADTGALALEAGSSMPGENAIRDAVPTTSGGE
jgi:hypothetical protein